MFIGKSTLQNEIIGDLEVELGTLPDGSEDMPLHTLGDAFSDSFSGQAGKQISNLVSKLISSKMPPSFNQPTIRQYLKTRWGLGPHRQNAVITFSVTLEPPSRLGSVDAAKEFYDNVALRYALFASISLNAESGGKLASHATLVDAEALQAARKESHNVLIKIHEVISCLVNELGGHEDTETTSKSNDNLLTDLDHWVSEFGEEMHQGTKPLFDTNKIRVYDSWWNWVRVELIALKHELEMESDASTDDPDRINMILNRWVPTCNKILEPISLKHSIASDLKDQIHSGKSRLPVFRYTKEAQGPQTIIDESGKIIHTEVPRDTLGQSRSFVETIKSGLKQSKPGFQKPLIQLKSRIDGEWTENKLWTSAFLERLVAGESAGFSFSGITALITGAGPGSIGSGIVEGLLEGGAHVFVTSRPPPAPSTKFFDQMYKSHGSKGSRLTVLPFNQASKQDCRAMIDYIYETKDGDRDIDVIIPFAAIGETGELDSIDAKSELAHRLMLTNLLRILGHIKQQKERRGLDARPTNVILPLSPNHGTFGGDGLYSESKLGLETLFNRFHSENWSDHLTICGAVIGWTRGTGLMNTNNILAEAVESQNAITFSGSEMAFSILTLIHPQLMAGAEDEPILADISGNLSQIQNFKEFLSETRRQLSDSSSLRKALNEENSRMQSFLATTKDESPQSTVISPRRHRTNIEVGYPSLPDFSTITAGLPNLKGMVDLSKTIVVVGFSELGPWGSSRTRWEVEHSGDFTEAGMLEIAWIMGLVDHFDGEIQGSPYIGWVDAKTKQPIHDEEIGSKFSKYVMEHTGIRALEPEILNGYDPSKKEFLHEVVLDEDLPSFEASKATAEAFRLQHGDNVSITPVLGSEDYQVKVKKGSRLLIPKSVAFDRRVAGLLPTGWNPARYGIPEDIITQVDPVTLYVLCCVCEALYSAGIQDPYEIFSHMHVSELANCIGTGAGGLVALQKMYRERYLEHPANNDIFQETFVNTMGAWANLLLLSSTGPIKTNSGACATAIE